MINIYKSIGRFSKSAISILKTFNEDFYVNNFLKSFDQQQFQEASIKINNKELKLVSVPKIGMQDKLLDEMADVILKNDSSNFLIQVDSTPYLFAKRQLYKQYHKNREPVSQIGFFDQVPVIPIEFSEARIDMNVFDALHLLKQKNYDPNLIAEIIDGDGEGLFVKTLDKINQCKAEGKELSPELEKESEDMSKLLGDLVQGTIVYNNHKHLLEFSKLSLFQALYMSTLKGADTFMIDLSTLYQRIYCGYMLSLPETQQMFKDICAEHMANKQQTNHLFEFQTMLWRQTAIEYYLMYSINTFCKETDDKEGTIIVDPLHFEPLRLALNAQKGQLISETNRSYFEEFSFPQPGFKETDEQYIEKHAILDSLLDFPIWNEPCVQNPFPYLSVDYLSLSPQEQKEIQAIFFKYHTKYRGVLAQVSNVNNTNNK